MVNNSTPLTARGAIGDVSGGSVLATGAGVLYGVNFTPTAGGNSIIVADCTTDAEYAASPTILCKIVCAAVDSKQFKCFNAEFKKGIYVVTTGATSVATLYRG